MNVTKLPRRDAGTVYLVGAGPGDPDLLTVKAARLLARAEVLAYDELISEEILALAPEDCERIPVGRRAKGCRHHEDKIHSAVIERARAGKMVVRLKGGDPMIFGRGGEEAEELARAGIRYE
ncbi:MAG: uroporphyrinogen-III C-methyltransferase, partial [Polyangiales bacterium]